MGGPNFIVYLGLPKVGYAVISLVFGTSGWSPAKVTNAFSRRKRAIHSHCSIWVMSSSDFRFKGHKGYMLLN